MSDPEFRGLFVPANPFQNIRTFFGTYDQCRQDLDCVMLEFIYLHEPHKALPANARYVFIGDEEARLKDHELNYRATWLAGYPYPLAGDMVLFRDDDADVQSIQPDLHATLIKAFINKGEY